MTPESSERPTLKEFDAYADRNGQDLGQDSARDIGLAQRTQSDLKRDPQGQAETARIASGTPGQDATDATEAETPRENLDRLRGEGQSGATEEAIERATAAVGQDDGKR
ncbi:hypothetical protein [Methylobacterium radiodurans]|uniref:Uncharacterized protein n=1 Tax=Methylobacterium radiodurans TaxID=2202828 RepID=A0A2U8VN98_9HYPH|nr:hypothetical protein [Methylobacterium radiodurans]AWN34856.1 hypothetical protein DK427_03135 [Methylobacterium radiodurans]